jgi:hypothetical protein
LNSFWICSPSPVGRRVDLAIMVISFSSRRMHLDITQHQQFPPFLAQLGLQGWIYHVTSGAAWFGSFLCSVPHQSSRLPPIDDFVR